MEKLPFELELVSFYLFIYSLIFREGGREGERAPGKHQCVVASRTPPTGDLARNPGMCPDWELNRRPFGWQVSTQFTEPHQPWHEFLLNDYLGYISKASWVCHLLPNWVMKDSSSGLELLSPSLPSGCIHCDLYLFPVEKPAEVVC